jgi:hypothetical protein
MKGSSFSCEYVNGGFIVEGCERKGGGILPVNMDEEIRINRRRGNPLLTDGFMEEDEEDDDGLEAETKQLKSREGGNKSKGNGVLFNLVPFWEEGVKMQLQSGEEGFSVWFRF